MKKLFSLVFVLISMLVTLNFTPVVPTVRAISSMPENRANSSGAFDRGSHPLSELLLPDGSLNLTSGFSGSIDPSGYSISYAPNGSPLFVSESPRAPVHAWNDLGGGLNEWVFDIEVVGSDIYVGGWFTNAGGNPNADYIARWDGSTWNALGSGPGPQ